MDFITNLGTLLKIKINAEYKKIVGVHVVPPIESEQEKIEVTHHDQDSPYRKFIPSGLINPGDYAFEMRSKRDEETQQTLYALYKSGEAGEFCIEHTDGLTEYFRAYVIGMTYNEADAEDPEPVNITVSLAISGDVTDEIESL